MDRTIAKHDVIIIVLWSEYWSGLHGSSMHPFVFAFCRLLCWEAENQREKTITQKGKRENTFSNFRLVKIKRRKHELISSGFYRFTSLITLMENTCRIWKLISWLYNVILHLLIIVWRKHFFCIQEKKK